MSKPIDVRLLAQLLDDLAGPLVMYAANWTASADDCMQESFVELARQIPPPERPTAWLYRVVKNRALNANRTQIRRTTHERLAALERNTLCQNSDKDNPEQSASANDEAEALKNAMRELTSSQRELVTLRNWSDLTWDEIAQITELSSSTAQRHYVVALEVLKKRLEKSCLTNQN